MLRHSAPRRQQVLVGVDAVSDIGFVRAEKSLERQCRKVTRLLIVLAAMGVYVVSPELVGDGPHGLGMLDGFAIDFDMLGEDSCGVSGGGQYADAFLGRDPEALSLRAGQVQTGMRFLERFGQDMPRRHLPELPFP